MAPWVRIPLPPPRITFRKIKVGSLGEKRLSMVFFRNFEGIDDLAKKANIKYTTLTKVESGVVNKPSVQTMANIAKALGVSIEGLIK